MLSTCTRCRIPTPLNLLQASETIARYRGTRWTSNATMINTSNPTPLPFEYQQRNQTLSDPSTTSTTSSMCPVSINPLKARRPRLPQLSKHTSYPRPSQPLEQSLALLPILAAQAPHHMTIHIHGKPYMVTIGDKIRLPTRIPDASIGTVLRLDRASSLGSRDFTFRGSPFIDPRYFLCRAIVMAIEGEPMRVQIKKKRRCRRKKTVRTKMRSTILRITELHIRPDGAMHENDPEAA